MSDDFKYDVFLSHSSKDKDLVRLVAERLKADGLCVWFDEWEIRAGDSIPAKIEEGLERSRVLVLCISANAFGSDWTRLESYTFRFRDPLNKERCFIQLRLDGTPVKGSLAQFPFLDWRGKTEATYKQLREACHPLTAGDTGEKITAFKAGRIYIGHSDSVNCVIFSADGHRILHCIHLAIYA